jgi:hypothetical protein
MSQCARKFLRVPERQQTAVDENCGGRGDPAADGTPLVSADDVRKRSRRKVFIEALDVETQFGRVPFVRLLT